MIFVKQFVCGVGSVIKIKQYVYIPSHLFFRQGLLSWHKKQIGILCSWLPTNMDLHISKFTFGLSKMYAYFIEGKGTILPSSALC